MKKSKNLMKAFRCVAFAALSVFVISCSGDMYETSGINATSLDVKLSVEGENTRAAAATFTQVADVAIYDVENFSTSDNSAYVSVELAEEFIENDIEPVVTETTIDENTTEYSVEKIKYATLEDGQVAKITFGYSYIEFKTTTYGNYLRYPYVKITDVALDDIDWTPVAGQEYTQDIPVTVSYMEVKETMSADIEEASVSNYSTSTAPIVVAYTKVGEEVVEPEVEPEIDPEPEVDPEPVITTEVIYTTSSEWETGEKTFLLIASVTKTEVTYEDGVETSREEIETTSGVLGFSFSLSEFNGKVADFATTSFDYTFNQELVSSTTTPIVNGNWTKNTVYEKYKNTFTNGVEGQIIMFEQTVKKGTLVFNDGVKEIVFDYNNTPSFGYEYGEVVNEMMPVIYKFGLVISPENNIGYDCTYTYNMFMYNK